MARSYEQRTLHFALPFVREDAEIKLHVGRARHVLQRHTTATLTAARQINRALRLLPDHQVTHFVPNLQLPADQAQLLLVSTTSRRPGARLPTLLLTKLHVPKDAIRRVLEHEREKGTTRRPDPALLAAGVEDDGTDPELPIDVQDWATALDAAVQAVFQHGELCNIGADNAAKVTNIIRNHAKGISDLRSQIYQQAEAHMKDPSASNWVEEEPYSNPDGSKPPPNSTVATKMRYVWSQRTQQWMLAPIQDSLRKVKNEPELQSSTTNAGNYAVLNGITAVGSPQNGDAPPRLRGVNLAATRPRRLGGSDTSWTVNSDTPFFGFAYNNDVELSGGTFSASFTNSFLRWLSLYVEFLDSDGKTPVVPEGWQSKVPGGLAQTYDSDTKKYVTLVESVSTILAVPLGAEPTEISFPWPPNASGVRILAGGIGRSGGIQAQDGTYHGGWDQQVCAAGAMMTGIFCLGLPTICLLMGASIGAARLKSLSKSLIGVALEIGSMIVDGAISGTLGGSDSKSIILCFADLIPRLLLDAPELIIAINAAVAEEAVEESTPIFGWIALGLSIATTVAELAETSIEVALSPAVFDLTATRAIDAQWTLDPDPEHKIWPREATHYIVTATFTDGTTRIAKGEMGPPPQTAPITVIFNAENEDQLPGGGTVQFDAKFYSDSGWLCGSATSPQLSIPIDADELTVPEQAIKENLIPLDATTRYLYQNSLTWDADKKQHLWASARPSATLTSLNPSNIGNNIGALGQITVNQPQTQLAYSWQASGQNIPAQPGGNPTNNQLFAFQTISTLTSPDEGLRFGPNGFVGAAAPLYDLTDGPSGNNFYLDPSNHLNHLRQILLDGSSGSFILPTNASWGRFNQPINACIVHSSGYAIGVNTGTAKLEVLRLPAASTTDATAPLANMFGGYGTRPGLMHQPVGVAPALGSGVIVLENADAGLQAPARMQGFDLFGNPAPIFAGNSPVALVRTEASPISCLAIATESKGYIYVLKYVGDGSRPEYYLLDIYSPDGSFLAQTVGLPASGVAVDLWRTLYSLDYQQITKPQGERTEPSVSVWVPPTPSN
jgi:hypothetical protein